MPTLTVTPSITCGNCKSTHSSVAQVKACYQSHRGQTALFAPKTTTTRPIAPIDVPAGHYAIKRLGVIQFYKVDKPTEGRWAGYTFVSRQVADNLHPIRNRDDREGVLRLIAEDPKEAMLRYGREIGSCGACGRTLTNPDSIKAGIGPLCASKRGW